MPSRSEVHRTLDMKSHDLCSPVSKLGLSLLSVKWENKTNLLLLGVIVTAKCFPLSFQGVWGGVATELGSKSAGRTGATSILNCSPICDALKEKGIILSQEVLERAQWSLFRLLWDPSDMLWLYPHHLHPTCPPMGCLTTMNQLGRNTARPCWRCGRCSHGLRHRGGKLAIVHSSVGIIVLLAKPGIWFCQSNWETIPWETSWTTTFARHWHSE